MTVRLADLEKPLESVVMPSSGRELPVVPLNGATAQLMQEYQKSGDALLLWEIVQSLIPTASNEEVKALTPVQASAVIAIASGKADELLKLIEEEAKEDSDDEGNQKAPAGVKPKARRRGTGSAS